MNSKIKLPLGFQFIEYNNNKASESALHSSSIVYDISILGMMVEGDEGWQLGEELLVV